MPTKFPKKIRLDLEAYRELLNPCAITICTHNRMDLFKHHEFGNYCVRLLKKLCDECSFRIFAYCFMPDHIHLLIQGDGTISIINLIQRFKSISTLNSRRFGFLGRIYQPRFYDHFLRKEDDIEKQAKYILENPIRKRLAETIGGYPLSGSMVFNIQ